MLVEMLRSTETMARDALKVMDHLGWKRAHIVGHSMGILFILLLFHLTCNAIHLVPQKNLMGIPCLYEFMFFGYPIFLVTSCWGNINLL